MNVHSYMRSKPVHGVTCRGIIRNEIPRDIAAATKQIQTDIPPRKAGTFDCKVFENCVLFTMSINYNKKASHSSKKFEGKDDMGR